MEQPLFSGQKTDIVEIPEYLVRETIDGIPFYYQGYEAVLHSQKKLEDIMGSSGLQSYIIATIVEFLNDHLNRETYKVLYNELGLHISHNTNLSSDISIFEKVQLRNKLNEKYLEISPKVAFEVDTKVESINPAAYEYVNLKTQKLIDFGTEQVIWIFTSSKKVLLAQPNEDWLTKNWDSKISVLDIEFSIGELLEQENLL